MQALIEYCTFHEKCPRSQLASNTFPNSYLSSLISRFLIPILSTGCLKKVANIIIGPEALPKLCAVGPSFASDITWERLILLSLSKGSPKKTGYSTVKDDCKAGRDKLGPSGHNLVSQARTL